MAATDIRQRVAATDGLQRPPWREPPSREPARAHAGFTLVEVLAVVLLTTLVIGVALSHYVNLSRATQRASQHTLGVRRAATLLDRVARDFESATLVAKPPEVDPLDHPWIFFGEPRRSATGADRLKFMTRGHRPRRDSAHESDLLTVVYTLRSAESEDENEQTFELMRWSSPQLPEPGSDLRRLPADESEGARLLADGLLDFGVIFIDEFGERTKTWDSSQLTESSALPAAVEIQVAFANDLPSRDGSDPGAPRLYRRTVLMRVGPLDLGELLDPNSLVSGGSGGGSASSGDDEDEDGKNGKGKCSETPCAGQPACSVINCAAKLRQLEPGTSLHTLVQNAIEANLEFCAWRGTVFPVSVRPQLIPIAACR